MGARIPGGPPFLIPLDVSDYGNTWNGALLESAPPGVVTSMVPAVAPLGTVALIRVSDTTSYVADTP
jgi:hypothetical protein